MHINSEHTLYRVFGIMTQAKDVTKYSSPPQYLWWLWPSYKH